MFRQSILKWIIPLFGNKICSVKVSSNGWFHFGTIYVLDNLKRIPSKDLQMDNPNPIIWGHYIYICVCWIIWNMFHQHIFKWKIPLYGNSSQPISMILKDGGMTMSCDHMVWHGMTLVLTWWMDVVLWCFFYGFYVQKNEKATIPFSMVPGFGWSWSFVFLQLV